MQATMHESSTLEPQAGELVVPELDRLHSATRQPKVAAVPTYQSLCRELEELAPGDKMERQLRDEYEPHKGIVEEHEQQERALAKALEVKAKLDNYLKSQRSRYEDKKHEIEKAQPLPLKNAIKATNESSDVAGRAAHRAMLAIQYAGGTDSEVAERVEMILNNLADARAAAQKEANAAACHSPPQPGLRTR